MNQEQIEKAKKTAANELELGRFEEVKETLKGLYIKKAKAEKIVKNIEREITDYEMELANS